MRKNFWPKAKVVALVAMVVIYLSLALFFKMGVQAGIIQKAPPTLLAAQGNDTMVDATKTIASDLQSAERYFDEHFVRPNGHIELYLSTGKNETMSDYNTNSEAITYYLLWKAQAGDKQALDAELKYMESYMMHPRFGYLMWRLNTNDSATGDGSNIASDADLRAIKALMIAEKKWGDKKYTALIDKLAKGLETLAISNDKLLTPYGGVSGETAVWKTNEVWLSYADFTVFEELAKRRGGIWIEVNKNMKDAVLQAQIHNGLYNSQLTERREYGNGIDGAGYSINSMWIMVRNAESNDPELRASANQSLAFYKGKFEQDGEIYAMYHSSGSAMSPSDTPWVYALVGRAAIALDDKEFSDKMIRKLLEKQQQEGPHAGAFPEGFGTTERIGQFTMQESIITLHDYVAKYLKGVQ